MPYRLELTWISHAKLWRKRYQNRTHYLKTRSNGRRDRDGYQAALREWQRLKLFLDGLGQNPYSHTGALIPENQAIGPLPVYFPPAPAPEKLHTIGVFPGPSKLPPTPQAARSPDDEPWILSVGIGPYLHPELVAAKGPHNPYAGERRISVLGDFWLEQRYKQVQRGELALKNWAEDKAKLQTFRDFITTNYPDVVFVDQIDASILNLYRDTQFDCMGEGDGKISRATLKKRLERVGKWLHWLIDQNFLRELPKDLKHYSKVKLDRPKLVFWTPDEIKELSAKATERTRLYIMLALNCGFTQSDIATLEASMVDWDPGIISRDRQKTGVASKFKLWPSTLALLKKHRNPKAKGRLLVNEAGKPLHSVRLNSNGNYSANDSIRLAFDRLLGRAKLPGGRSFKHLRKSAANEIEKVRPDLTSLFLAHSEKGTKRFYVEQHYSELFVETDTLARLYGF